MPTRFNSRTSSNARKGGLQQCTLSLLTAAMLLAGVQAAPVLAATDEQPATRSVGNYKFAISQQPLASALNDFSAVTGWQVGLPAKFNPQTDLAWVQGRLVFENCPMGKVLDEVRRYYPGWIVNTNDTLANVSVTGNYRLDQPLDIVRSLAHITSSSLSEYPALVILN